jgi:hypothetical protein
MYRIKQYSSFHEVETDYRYFSKSKASPFFELGYFYDFYTHFSENEEIFILGVFKGDEIVGLGFFERVKEAIIFLGMKKVLGGNELTDFGDILVKEEYSNNLNLMGEIWEKILDYFREKGFLTVRLDYVRNDSGTYAYFKKRKEVVEINQEEVSPYIKLEGFSNFEDYIKHLPRVKRKELRRKFRRLEGISHKYEYINSLTEGDFNDFVRLHRLSDFSKKKFMSKKMKEFFHELVFGNKEGWDTRISFLDIENKRVASLLSFENENETLLYNSGYDPGYAFYSVGVLLGAKLIEKAIKEGKRNYDFLRGNERYKYDLGGIDLPLWKILVTL